MSIETELTKLQTNLENAYTAIDNKGGTIPANQNFDNLASSIGSIATSGGTPYPMVTLTVPTTLSNNISMQLRLRVYLTSLSSTNNYYDITPYTFSSESYCTFYFCLLNSSDTIKIHFYGWGSTLSFSSITYSINNGAQQTASNTSDIDVPISNNTTINISQIIGMDSCVPYYTSITYSDNSTKQISEVNVGDVIKGYNCLTNEFINVNVLGIHKHKRDKLIHIILDNGDTIDMTEEHVLLSENGWVSYNPEISKQIYKDIENEIIQLNTLSKLLNKDNTFVKIKNISEIILNEQIDVYTLDVTDGIDTFMTNGYVSHNKY